MRNTSAPLRFAKEPLTRSASQTLAMFPKLSNCNEDSKYSGRELGEVNRVKSYASQPAAMSERVSEASLYLQQ